MKKRSGVLVPGSFSSQEAEAAFWDATDLTTLAAGELVELNVSEPPAPVPPSVSYSVRLSRADVERLRAAAERHGVGATSLARTYILRELALEDAVSSDPHHIVDRLRRDVDDLAAALRDPGT